MSPTRALLRADKRIVQLDGARIVERLLALDELPVASELAAFAEQVSRLGLSLPAKIASARARAARDSLRRVISETRALGLDVRARIGEPWVLGAGTSDGSPIVPLSVGLRRVWLGPSLVPGAVPCHNCVHARWLGMDDRATALKGARLRERVTQRPELAIELLSAEAALEIAEIVIRWVDDRSMASVLVEVDAAGRAKRRRVEPLPGCSRCRNVRSAVVLPSERPAERSLWELVEQRLGHRTDPVLGLVAEIETRTDECSGMTIAVARYSDPSGTRAAYRLDPSGDALVRTRELPRVAFGAGRTPEDARARALLEAIERYTGIYQSDVETVRASARELGDAAVDVPALLGYDTAQLDVPGYDQAQHSLRVPARFDPDAPIDWSSVRTMSGSTRYVPTSFLYDGFEGAATPFRLYDTNGSAAGIALDDTIVRAFLEVVERDAVGIWWYNRIVRPAVDVDSFDDFNLSETTLAHRRAGRSCFTLDLTHDFAIPVFVAIARLPDGTPLLGFGADFHARGALESASRELAQASCFAESEAAKWAGVDWRDQWQLVPAELPARTRSEYDESSEGIERATPARCASVAAAVGLELLVRERRRADVPLSSVRAIMPGARGVWPRFGPGRLYDVPVTMGWRAEPTTRSDLNPVYLRT